MSSSQENPPAYGVAQPPPPQGGGYGYQPVPTQEGEEQAFAAQRQEGYGSINSQGYAPAPRAFPGQQTASEEKGQAFVDELPGYQSVPPAQQQEGQAFAGGPPQHQGGYDYQQHQGGYGYQPVPPVQQQERQAFAGGPPQHQGGYGYQPVPPVQQQEGQAFAGGPPQHQGGYGYQPVPPVQQQERQAFAGGPPQHQGGYGYQPVPPVQQQEGQAFAGGPPQHQGGHGYQGHAPAPGAVPAQQAAHNVVVMNQPAPVARVVGVAPRSHDYMTLTIVMMVICFFHGNFPAFICLIPALMFANMAADNNATGNYDAARQYGRKALWCNIGVFIYYGIAVGVVVAAIIIVFVVAAVESDSTG